MNASTTRRLVLPFVAILGLLFFPASGGFGDSHPQGRGYSTVTFYVA